MEKLNIQITKKSEGLEEEFIKKHSEQLENDKIKYKESITLYNEWKSKINKLKEDSISAFNMTDDIIAKFNKNIEKIMDSLNEEEKKVILNRQKGINMINRMSQNVLNNIIDRELACEEIEFVSLNELNDFNNKKEYEIMEISNKNYSIISNIVSLKDKYINTYFSYIQTNILPILDAIQSGITFIKNSERKIIKEEVVPVYKKLEELFDEFLNKCNIEKINVNSKDKINIRFTEILEVEIVKDKELDETVESIIRNGYEYLEDIYGTGYNHILRNVQIIANKTE